MKVLLLSNMYPEGNSYFGIFVKRQVEALEAEGVEILPVVRTKDTFPAYLFFVLRSLFHVLFASYDIVHAHYGFHSALIPAIVGRKKLLVTYHGSDALQEPFRNKLYYHLQKFVVMRADHLIAVSNDVKNTLVQKLGAQAGKVSVISCGVDSSRFTPRNKAEVRRELGLSETAKIVLFVGKIHFMKGVDILYECAGMMRDVIFILVGNGPLRTDLENCMLVGPKPNDEMPKWMSAADIFALPSRSEGTPVVILEALSCGTPVISSDVGGCPDLVKDGHAGYLFPIGNAAIFQEKITSLVNDDSMRIQMGNEGRRVMVNYYDNKRIAKRISNLYNKYPS
jgi:glycosyltransferase involved in cell wall biosynthesis